MIDINWAHALIGISAVCWAFMVKDQWKARHLGPAMIQHLMAKAEFRDKMATLRKARRTVWERYPEADRRAMLDRLEELDEEAQATYYAARDRYIAA